MLGFPRSRPWLEAWRSSNAEAQEGQYPDATPDAGLSVEFYCGGDVKPPYVEHELLSPLREVEPGGKLTHTIPWSLHRLPHEDANSHETASAIGILWETPASR